MDKYTEFLSSGITSSVSDSIYRNFKLYGKCILIDPMDYESSKTLWSNVMLFWTDFISSSNLRFLILLQILEWIQLLQDYR